jgi:hypothetical protein
MASTLSPLLAANSFTLVFIFSINFTEVALLTGYHLLGVGVAGLFFVATARVWGKRHLYLLGTILIIVASAWGGSVGTNYTSLLWARVLQGVGLAPFEALVNASVGDLYHVHVGHTARPHMRLTRLATREPHGFLEHGPLRRRFLHARAGGEDYGLNGLAMVVLFRGHLYGYPATFRFLFCPRDGISTVRPSQHGYHTPTWRGFTAKHRAA